MRAYKVYPACFLSYLCLFLLLARVASAEMPSLSGTVLDQSSRPIPAVAVRLYANTTAINQTQTAANGRFEFLSLVPGTYILECRKEGFQSLSRRFTLEDSPQSASLTLQISGLNQRVVVIASELPEIESEISKSVSLISREELTDRAVVTLSEVLRQIPSLQVHQLGGPGTLASYRFRGLRPEDTAVLLDGFRFLDSSDNKNSARPLLADLLVTDAERIEVLRGASSALYGTNAIGGTVNVVSRQPSEPLAGDLNFEGGSLGLLRGGAGISGQDEGQRFTYSVRADHTNYLRGLDGRDAYRNNAGSFRSTYDRSLQTHLFASFQFADTSSLLNESPSPLPGLPPLPPKEPLRKAVAYPRPGANFYPQFDDPDFQQRNRFFRSAVRLDQTVNRFWDYSLGYQGLITRRRYEDGPGVASLARELGFQEPTALSRESYQGTASEVFWRNSFRFTSVNSTHVAVDFDRASLDQTAFGLSMGAAQRSVALQVQNQTRLLDGRWHWQIALRAQRYGLDSPRFSDSTDNPYSSLADLQVPATYSGDIATAYFFPNSGTKVRLHAGNGYRSPSLYERFGGDSFGGFRSYYGDPGLRAERAVFVDAGLDQFALRDQLQVSGTYFYTHLQTIIAFGPTPPNDPFHRFYGYINPCRPQQTNTGAECKPVAGGNARGFELSLSFRPASFLDLNSSYTFTNSDQPSPTSAGMTKVLGLSDHQFVSGVNIRPARRLNLNFQALAVSEHDFPVFGLLFTIPPQTYRFQGYTLIDLTASYLLWERERSRLRVVFRGENLLNQEYFQEGFLAPRATARAGIHFDF
ncbi:MAG: TonB-dependent receptor [Acidobacteria bacterium]|nr:TonB-dependent receptor [Acidobacteriota bacterium]